MLFYSWNIALSQQAHENKVAPLEQFLLPFVRPVCIIWNYEKIHWHIMENKIEWSQKMPVDSRCCLQSRGAPVCPAAGWRGPNCALYLVTTQATTRQYSAESDGRRREERVGGGEVGCWWWAGLGTTGTRQWPCGPASLVPAPSRPHIGDMGTPAQPLISRYVEE